MNHLTGLTAKGVEHAMKVNSDQVKGFISWTDYQAELTFIRDKHTLDGLQWVVMGDTHFLVKVYAVDSQFVVPCDSEADEGFCETTAGSCYKCGAAL